MKTFFIRLRVGGSSQFSFLIVSITKQKNTLHLFLLSVCWNPPLINSSNILLWSWDKGKVKCNSQMYSSFATAWDHSWLASSTLNFLTKESTLEIWGGNLKQAVKPPWNQKEKVLLPSPGPGLHFQCLVWADIEANRTSHLRSVIAEENQ